jgi:hypothetical protein
MSTEIAATELTAAIVEDEFLKESVQFIRTRVRRATGDILAVGRRLATARTRIRSIYGHGHWYPWLQVNFSWSVDTADRYIHIAELSKSRELRDLDLPFSSLCLIGAPSTPEKARDEIIERAKAGEQVSVAEVKETIARGKRKAKGVADPAPITPDDAGQIEQAEAAPTDTSQEHVKKAIAGTKRKKTGIDAAAPAANVEESPEESAARMKAPFSARVTPPSPDKVATLSTNAVVLRDWKTGEEHVEVVPDEADKPVDEVATASEEDEPAGKSLTLQWELASAEDRAAFLDEIGVDAVIKNMSPEFGRALRARMSALKDKPFKKTMELVATSSSNRSRH